MVKGRHRLINNPIFVNSVPHVAHQAYSSLCVKSPRSTPPSVCLLWVGHGVEPASGIVVPVHCAHASSDPARHEQLSNIFRRCGLAAPRNPSQSNEDAPSFARVQQAGCLVSQFLDLSLHPIHTMYQRCRKVVCIGRNYADHVKELQNQKPMQPFYFLKPPSSILMPGAGPVICPRGVNLHYEVELALVIGRDAKDLDPDDQQAAMDVIEGGEEGTC